MISNEVFKQNLGGNCSYTFREFAELVCTHIKSFLPESFKFAEVTVSDVTKQNNITKTGLTVRKENRKIVPTVYLNDVYEEYKNGEDLIRIYEAIAKVIVENEAKEDLNVEELLCWENAKSRVFPRIVNAKMNEKLLLERPHSMIADLAVLYDIRVVVREDGVGTIGITDKILEHNLKVSVEELHTAALQNMLSQDEAKICPMSTLLKRMGMDVPDEMEGKLEQPKLLILTNERGVSGSNQLLNTELLDDLAEKIEGKLVILPSSLHEVIILKCPEAGLDELSEMVRTINATVLAPQDILSDHAYVYERKKGLRNA